MRSRFALLLLVVLFPVGVSGAEFYVDPQNGDPGGDGSASDPWRTIQEVVEAGLIESREWESYPYEDGLQLVAKNPGAPVKAGDTIYLRSGYHGELFIQSCYNQDYVTIAAEAGHAPRLKSAHIQSSSHWIVRGLHISPEHAPQYEQVTLFNLEHHGYRGPIHDVTVEDCRLQSVEDSSGWSADDWNNLSCNGFGVDGESMTVRNNVLKNVNFGISVGARNSLIEGNLVENFAGDGMRGLGDHTVFQYNTVKNCYDVNANHDDGFQSWSRGADGVGTGEVTGIVLRGNTIINYSDPAQPHRGTLQGIGCFDGMFVDWVVENNVIITDHWHGITLSGARNCRIVNNTVMDLNDQDPGPPWVRIGNHKDGTRSTGCVVRNNLTTSVNIDADSEVTEDHNLIIDDPDALFEDAANKNLHLLQGCPAVDTGSADLAPQTDIEGIPRPQGDGFDIGAYEYHEGVIEEPETDAGTDGSAGDDAGEDAGADTAAGDGGSPTDGTGKVQGDCDCGNGGGGTALLLLPLLYGLLRIPKRNPPSTREPPPPPGR
jgi:hypothetical protein